MVDDWFLEEFRLAASQLIDEIDPSKDECWMWSLYSYFENTYEIFVKQRDGVRHAQGTHRLSYMLFHGEIPEDKPIVMHTCDTPWCWNFHHLIAGTSQENSQDMVVKDRHGGVARART